MELTKKYTQSLTRHSNKFFDDFQDRLSPEKVEELLKRAFEKISAAKNEEEWEESILYWNETKSHIQTHFELIELAFQCDTQNEKIEKEERRLKEELEPLVDEWNAKIREKILGSGKLPALKEKFGAQYFLILQLQQDAFDPKNIELETELNHVLADYTKLVGGASFEVDGKKYPLSLIKKFSCATDGRLRKESFLSFSGWFLNHRDQLEKIFDKSINLRDKMGRVLGHDGFIPLGYRRLYRADYGPEEVAKLREEILEVIVPICRKIRKWQAEGQGSESVSIWDADFFPALKLGDLKVPIERQTEAGLKIFQKLSPTLAGHFKKMIDGQLIDVEAREGKAPGAFCTDFSDYRVPFLFLNSVDEANDVTTMLHECGHAFQAWESRIIDPLELRWPTLEACEVHSMGMEFLAYPYYEEFFTEEDARLFRIRNLAESIILIPYIAMVDEFQHLVYSGQAVGAEGRGDAWERLEEKYFPGIDFSGRPEWKRHRWIRQLHIFKVPFYYIDYAIAQIGAWQLWIQSIKDKEGAMENYLNLCRLGGKLPLKEFFIKGNLRLPFEKGVLKPLMENILKVQPIF